MSSTMDDALTSYEATETRVFIRMIDQLSIAWMSEASWRVNLEKAIIHKS